jgi:hypothetical protein
MDATSERRGSAIKETSVPRRPIERSGGTEEKLPYVHRTAGEITADQIVVPVLKRGGRREGTRDDAIAEARSEPFDLNLDWLEAISSAAVPDVAIGPGRMPGN